MLHHAIPWGARGALGLCLASMHGGRWGSHPHVGGGAARACRASGCAQAGSRVFWMAGARNSLLGALAYCSGVMWAVRQGRAGQGRAMVGIIFGGRWWGILGGGFGASGMLRSYHTENAGSHQIPEAKLCWAGLVLDSGMIWESPVS